MDVCRSEMPPLLNCTQQAGIPPHWSACWYVQGNPQADLLAETTERTGEGGSMPSGRCR